MSHEPVGRTEYVVKLEEEVKRLRDVLRQVQSAMAATGQAPDGMPDYRRPLATAVWAALGDEG